MKRTIANFAVLACMASTAQAGTQCFPQSGTYGDVTVTQSCTGSVTQNIIYGGLSGTALWGSSS